MTDTAQAKKSELVTVRDTVESIWVAIVLAFVLRAFMVEAFVIPTGSMAPRLMGEHWDIGCPCCAYEYAFGMPKLDDKQTLNRNLPTVPGNARCPNCGRVYGDSPQGPATYVNSGDRVLVLKYLYDFRDERPWDVIVFRNPQNNRENYIKRLIGLPGETIQIVHGDIWVQNPKWPLDAAPGAADGAWHIRRKPPQAQEAMWQVVFDNDFQPDPRQRHEKKEWKLVDETRSSQWLDSTDERTAGGRRFVFKGSPDAGDFDELVFSADDNVFMPRYGYNAPLEEEREFDRGSDFVSDLKLALTFVPAQADSRIRLQTSSLENHFRAELCADGKAVLSYMSPDTNGGRWRPWGKPVQLPALDLNKGHELALVHVDMRVAFYVDGREVLASTDEDYPPDFNALAARLDKSATVPAPQVLLSVAGGASEIWHVKLMRDVYYTCPRSREEPPAGPLGDYARSIERGTGLSRPRGAADLQLPWGCRGHPIELGPDSFFVLGDNSPQSLDGRRWTSASPTLQLWKDPKGDESADNALYQLGTVPRYNMIGKALFVYWPAGFRPPGLPSIPIIPNVGRMRLIR